MSQKIQFGSQYFLLRRQFKFHLKCVFSGLLWFLVNWEKKMHCSFEPKNEGKAFWNYLNLVTLQLSLLSIIQYIFKVNRLLNTSISTHKRCKLSTNMSGFLIQRFWGAFWNMNFISENLHIIMKNETKFVIFRKKLGVKNQKTLH